MDVHNNARLTPKGREAMVRTVVEDGLSKAGAARQFNTTAKTSRLWQHDWISSGARNVPRDWQPRRTRGPVGNEAVNRPCLVQGTFPLVRHRRQLDALL